jgi:hypothetical protein
MPAHGTGQPHLQLRQDVLGHLAEEAQRDVPGGAVRPAQARHLPDVRRDGALDLVEHPFGRHQCRE